MQHNNIKELRLKDNYTQNFIAHELGISQKTYSNMENGKSKITLPALKKLSEIYIMDLPSLVKYTFKP